MVVTKRVPLGTTEYYVTVDTYYDDKKNLCIKNYEPSYFDGGDLGCLLDELSERYDSDKLHKRFNHAYLVCDALYLYEHIPFISGVGVLWMSHEEAIIGSSDYIKKEELDEIIKTNNYKMKDTSDFKLWNGTTWFTNEIEEE